MKILAIDDNAAVLEVIALMLTSDGHSVATAGGGRDALARLEAGETVDLVLTDLAMPEMSGWEVVQAVRSRWPELRVGVITGAPLCLQEQREPVDVLIRKPVTLEDLCGAIAGCDRPATPAPRAARPPVLLLDGEPRRSNRWVLLVRKGQDAVYEYLRRLFRADTRVEVVMDRRTDLSRNPAGIADRLRTRDVAVIRKDDHPA